MSPPPVCETPEAGDVPGHQNGTPEQSPANAKEQESVGTPKSLPFEGAGSAPIDEVSELMSKVLLQEYPFLSVMWTLLVIFAWGIWFWLLIVIFADLFRRPDVSGWGKAAWVVFLILLPFLGVLVYLISQSKGMAERRAREVQASQAQFDQYVRSVATGSSPTSQIESAKQLLDKGSITREEFEEIKRKAIASA